MSSTTMDSPPPHKNEEIIELKNEIGTKVHSFFQCLTPDQWELMKSCTPDESTKDQLSELLLQIVNTLSNVFLKPTWRNIIPEEDIQANLGNLVTDTFKIALDINDNVQCESADNLLKLINEEVAERVNNPESALPTHPKRLHMMVVHAVKMTKNFLGRVKKVVTYRSEKRSSIPDQETEMLIKEEECCIENFWTKPDGISEPLTEEDKTEGGKHLSILESEPTLDGNKKAFVQAIVEKLFSRIFTEARDCDIKEHKDILLRLIESSWANVKAVDFELSLKNLKSFDRLIFKDMCKQLGGAAQVLLSLKREDDAVINSVVTVFNRSVAAKTTKGICNFFASVCQRRQRVGVTEDPAEVEEVEPLAIEVADSECDGSKPDAGPTLEMKKEVFVEIVIEKLFSRMVDKKLDCTIVKPRDTLLRLFDRTLVEVEGVDVELSQKTLQNLDKIIFKDLCKKLGCADRVLISLRMEDEAIVKAIVYAISCSGTPKKTERRRTSSSFSSSRQEHRKSVI